MGVEQFKALYKKAVVVGVKVTIRLHNESSVGIMFGVTPMPESQSTTALTAFQHYMELPSTKARLLSPEVDHSVLTYTLGTRKYLHIRDLIGESTCINDLVNGIGASRTSTIHFWAQPVDASTTSGVEMVITADFLVRLFDHIVPARSTDS